MFLPEDPSDVRHNSVDRPGWDVDERLLRYASSTCFFSLSISVDEEVVAFGETAAYTQQLGSTCKRWAYTCSYPQTPIGSLAAPHRSTARRREGYSDFPADLVESFVRCEVET